MYSGNTDTFSEGKYYLHNDYLDLLEGVNVYDHLTILGENSTICSWYPFYLTNNQLLKSVKSQAWQAANEGSQSTSNRLSDLTACCGLLRNNR